MRSSLAPLGVTLLSLACSSCAAPPAPPSRTLPVPPATPGPSSVKIAPAPAPSAAETPRGSPFGGDRWGFAEASSADGRIVVLRRFDGDARPRFGQHGESATPTRLTVFDTTAGTERDIDELIDVEPGRRWMLVVEGGQPRLFDARSGASTALGDVDAAADQNRCLPPRMASFSPAGKRVGWMTATGLRVRDLAGGDEWRVKAQGRLWRGWPEDDARGATLLEVPVGSAEWPHQRTSCACRWCGRFAMSYGVYGWDGPTFDVTHVAEDGARTTASPPESKREWHGKTDAGCTLHARTDDDELERGPWQWRCPAH